MMATYWLTRSMRTSEPVVGVTPTMLPARTAALCAVAMVPFACGCLALLRFVQLIPVSSPLYGPFSPSARVAVLVGQIVIPALGGPLLGVALGRWVRFPGAAFVLFLLLYGWVSVVTILSMSHRNSAPVAVLRLFAPFAFFTYTENGVGVTAWRGSPWFFIGWQLALCAIAVLVALLRGAEGRVRTRIIRALGIAGVAALILLVLAGHRRVHPPPHRVMTGAVLRAGAWPAVAGVSGAAVVVGGCGAAFPAAATVLLPICFTLLAAAAAFTLDEPASLVVDVTPTGPVRRTGIRAVALLAPLAAGTLVLLAAALRGLALPWASAGLALLGNVLFGFAAACVVRTRTGEPGAAAGTAVVLVLMAPSLVPQVARFVRTFPAPGAGGLSPDTVWWTVLAVCAVAITVSVGGRNAAPVDIHGSDLPAAAVLPDRPAPVERVRSVSQASAGGWSAPINLTSTRGSMTATGTGHTVIDVRPAAPGGEAGEVACTRSRSPLVMPGSSSGSTGSCPRPPARRASGAGGGPG